MKIPMEDVRKLMEGCDIEDIAHLQAGIMTELNRRGKDPIKLTEGAIQMFKLAQEMGVIPK